MQPRRIGLAVIAHPNEVGFSDASIHLAAAEQMMARNGVDTAILPFVISSIEGADRAFSFFHGENICGLVLLSATWSNDFTAARLADRLRVPILVWALRGVDTGSLCGSQQIAKVLQDIGLHCRINFGEILDPATITELRNFSNICRLIAELRLLRVGLLGHRTFGMTEIAVNEISLRKVIGPEIVPLSQRRFMQQVASVTAETAEKIWKESAIVEARITSEMEAILEGAKFLVALRRLCTENQLGAIAVDCYPDLMGRFCFAASVMAGEGIVVGCEGDVNGAVAQFMLQRLTGQAVHNTDLLDVDPEEQTALFSHCGSSHPDLALSPQSIEYGPVRLSADGLCVLFPAKPGPVTLVNLVCHEMNYCLTIIQGEAVVTDMVFPGNPTKVVLPCLGRSFIDFIHKNRCGHHWMIGYGHIASVIAEMAEIIGLECVELS